MIVYLVCTGIYLLFMYTVPKYNYYLYLGIVQMRVGDVQPTTDWNKSIGKNEIYQVFFKAEFLIFIFFDRLILIILTQRRVLTTRRSRPKLDDHGHIKSI